MGIINFMISNPLIVLIIFLVIVIAIQIIKSSRRARKEIDRIKNEYESSSYNRDVTFAKMQEQKDSEITDLKKQINELTEANLNLRTNYNNLKGQKYKDIEVQIQTAAIEKIQQDPRISPFFATMWDNAKKEATKEIEDASIGKRILNFLSIKNVKVLSGNHKENEEAKLIDNVVGKIENKQ